MAKDVADWIHELSNGEKKVWREAIRALGYIGADSVPPLLEALVTDSAPIERIAEVFGLIGVEAFEPLSALMAQGATAQERISAARAMQYIKDVRLLPALVDALRDKDVDVRAQVALTFKEFSDPRAVAPLLQASETSDELVRANIALALGSYYRDPRAKPRLIALTKDQSSLVRRHAVRSLSSFQQDEQVVTLLEAMTQDNDEQVRQFAAASLQALKGDRMVFQRLERNKEDITRITDEAYQRMVADGTLDEDDLDVMRHSNPMVRARLLEAVGEQGRETALALILPALTDINPAVRKTAINSLVRMGASALDAMRPHLNDNSKYIRAGIVEAMGIIGDAACLDMIDNLVNDRAVEVRLQVAKTAGHFADDPRAVRILSAFRRDTDKQVRDIALESLESVGITENRITNFLRRLRRD